MGSFNYENQGTNTYLVYKIAPEDTIDTMSLGMLANNRIPGLAPAMFTQMDTSKYIKFNVSARISASQLFQGNVNKKRLVGVFSGIVDAMLSAEDYMIDPSSILLQLDYIFVDVSTCDTVLICLPILGNNSQQLNLGAFFKGIMFSTQFDQTENCDYVAKIINYLNSTPAFSLPDFKQVLDGIKGSPNRQQPQPQIQSQQNPPVQRVQQPAPVMTAQPVQQPQMQRPIVQQPQAQPYYQQPQQAQPVRPTAPAQATPMQPVQQQKRPAQQQMQVPQTTVPQSIPSAPAQVGSQEDSISLFYLLQHYNKENAARYKAQKEAKKQQAGMPPAAPQEKPKKEKKKKEAAQPSFTVPGAPQGPSFAIPGQAAPISSGYTPAPQPQPVQQQAAQRTQQQNYSVQPAPIQQPAYQTQAAPTYQSQTMPQYAQPQTTPMNFGETTVLGGGTTIGETTVLGAGAQNVQLRPHLIRSKNNERIDISKPVFRIGKERSYVDYFIGDNTAVSRSHANIISRDGEYFIVDTNSTNHTYVNGGMILSNSETKLSHGTKIRLANEEFEFRLY